MTSPTSAGLPPLNPGAAVRLPTCPTLRLLSLGAGVQSTTLALLAAEGALPRLDGAIFADTGWEPAAVYAHLDRLEPVLVAAGIPVHRVGNGNLRADELHPSYMSRIPLFVTNSKGGRGGITSRTCTQTYKLTPVQRKTRLLLGAATSERSCRYCEGNGRRVPPWAARKGGSELTECSICRGTGQVTKVGPPPRGTYAETWIGFSTDELGRAGGNKRDPGYARSVYPLLDLGMSRKDCLRFLGVRGWTVAKSACIGCPFHGNRAWRELRANPAEWADAVAFDAGLRTHGENYKLLRGVPYLHSSLRPLSEAPIDRVSRRERADAQTDLLDAIADLDAGYDPDEDGDPDGCSPYGCRSGAPAGGAA